MSTPLVHVLLAQSIDEHGFQVRVRPMCLAHVLVDAMLRVVEGGGVQ